MRLKLRNLRLANGLSVPEIAEKLGISASFYYKIESGARNPTISLAKHICKVIGGNIDEIFFASGMDETSRNDNAGNQVSA